MIIERKKAVTRENSIHYTSYVQIFIDYDMTYYLENVRTDKQFF